MKAVKKIEISVLYKRPMPLVVYTMQGDTGREIECTVVDWDIPAGATARVWVVKPSKKVVYSDGKIMENSVVFSLTNQMLAEPGVAICIIEFASGDDVVSSFPFNLCIDGSARGDGIPSENESTVLEGMFEALGQDAIKALDEAKAEAAAANKSAQDTEKIKNDFTLTAQQAVADVNNAGQTQTQRVNTAGDTQVSRVQTEGTTQVQNVQATAAEIASDREQIHTNRDNTARLQRISAGAITRSAEGSFITLEDAADGMGFRRIEIPGTTEQRTTTGAQLFDFDVWKGAECIRGTAVYSNNGMVLTATENDAYTDHTASAARIKVEPNTTYTFSWEHSGASGYVYIFSNGTNVLASPVNTSKKSTFTTREDTTFISFRVGVNAKGGVASYSNIMCNTGEAVIPWEPYSGAMPSPSPGWSQELENVGALNEAGKYEVKVTACKNNLLDMTGAKGGTAAGITTTVNPDGTLTSNGTGTGGPVVIWLLGGYRPVTTDNVLMVLQAGKTYYISDVVLYMGTEYTAQNKFFVDPEKYPDGCKVTGVRHPSLDSGTVLTNQVYHPRVILGDTDTGWEPYRGHTATITSDRPLTQWDKLTCRDGVWGWAYGGSTTVYDGSNDETWTLQSINGNGIANFQITLNGAVSNFDSSNMCSHFPHQTEAIANVTKPGFLISNSTGKSILYIRIPSTTASTVEAFKAWLAEHIMTVQYQTDTETWVPLSHEEQAAMNALCTYAGTTHIWTDDPLQPVISVDYTLDTEGYIKYNAPAYRDVAKFALVGEASGAMATCMDSADWPLLGIGVQGKCEQVTTTGAQLFDVSTAKDGCYVSDSTGGEGCGTDGVGKFASDYIPVVPACNITFDKKTAWGAWYNAQKQFISGFVRGEPRTITAPENAAYMRFTGYLDSKNVMVNVGDSTLPWEPYTGGAPSPSPAYPQEVQETGTYNPETGMYEADMVMTGAQLIDFEQCLKNWNSQYTQVDGRVYTVTALGTSFRQPISFSKNDIKVTLSGNVRDISGSGYRVDLMDSAGNVVGRINKDIKSVTGMASKIRLNFAEAGSGEYTDIMLNVGDTALPWEPYQSDTLHLTADQPWRGIGDAHDEVCERDGVLGTWRRYTTVDNNIWRLNDIKPGTTGMRFCAVPNNVMRNQLTTIMCSHFSVKNKTSYSEDGEYLSADELNVSGLINIRVKENFPATTSEGFREWGKNNDLHIVCLLKTPVWEPFPEEIQRAYRKLKSYAGTTHAWVDDPLQPEVSFKYIKDSKLVLGKLEDRLAALETAQAQTTAAFGYLPANIQAEMIENETNQLMDSI